MSKVGSLLTALFSQRHAEQQIQTTSDLGKVDPIYEAFAPYSLGTHHTPELRRRDRKEIYTNYKLMQKDPTIGAAMNLLTTAALGGHESRGEVVFISPADHIRGEGIRAKELRKRVESEKKYLQQLINQIIFAFTRYGISYGDAFARVYPIPKIGVAHILCDEHVEPPLIQAFEQAGRTVGFHALEQTDYSMNQITKLTRNQMVRMKMQRISPVPQYRMDKILQRRLLLEDNLSQVPIIPSPVGGSFLQDVEGPWEDMMMSFAALNSQQIADSVKELFVTVDVSTMPPANREIYKKGLMDALLNQHEKIKDAMKGGDPLWAANYIFMPQWGDKQVFAPLGDIAQRTSPISMELVMTHLRRAAGALGLDISLLGWADMLAGGLGDGAAFHTSAQVMQRAALVRQAVTEPLIDIIIMHYAYKYGEVYSRNDLPFKIEFYSDISAASTESLNNKNTRSNTLMMTAQSIDALKNLKLGKEADTMLLTEYLGMDDDKAELIAVATENSILAEEQKQKEQFALQNGGIEPTQGSPNPPEEEPQGEE